MFPSGRVEKKKAAKQIMLGCWVAKKMTHHTELLSEPLCSFCKVTLLPR